MIGKIALEKRLKNSPKYKLITLQIDSRNALVHGGASVIIQDRVVGTVTSGEWGYRIGMNLAYAFVEAEHAGFGTTLYIDILG
mgnify:CR=1 FL=1